MKESVTFKPKIVIHCQYVYGIGHFVRTLELAKGLSQQFCVFILNGGEIVPNFEIPPEINMIQLPAIYKEENADTLSPVDSKYSIEECFERRKYIITDLLSNLKPDLLITEHFPFGLLFKDEVIELISNVKFFNSKVKIICSVRDIIESSNGGKYDKTTVELLNRWYDMVLIHGDQNCIHLKRSFPRYNDILIPVYHTGYIVKNHSTILKVDNPIPIILASIAGGRLGKELLRELISNHSFIYKSIKHKLILFSGAFESNFDELKREITALKSSKIELNVFDRKSYLDIFSKADLVISLGGYNSVIESISNGKKLLVYQREFTQGNKEQDLRIRLFKDLGLLNVIYPNDFSSNTIVESIRKSLDFNIDRNVKINLNGTECSSDLILKLYRNLQLTC